MIKHFCSEHHFMHIQILLFTFFYICLITLFLFLLPSPFHLFLHSFFFPFPLWFITGTEYSFLCYTVGPCCLSILYVVVCFWIVFSKWRSRNVQKKENHNWNVPSFLISPTRHILLVLGVWQNEGYEWWPHMKYLVTRQLVVQDFAWQLNKIKLAGLVKSNIMKWWNVN